ncbi:MAG: hypothetical protein KZQ96_20625 [Candidatus Thiodiazotropha sp. (ex Lucinoma borealis)]|nr:hypothetical protein [Candidatus Thiodiazotropha sp. (ex Lucinoma borealis)]
MNNDINNQRKSWWHSFPRIIAALAGLITAVTGLVAGLSQIGVFNDRSLNSQAIPPVSNEDYQGDSNNETFENWWRNSNENK